jgi:hypothetical protein
MPPATLPTLLESTKQLLATDPRNTNQIANAAGVNYFWLRKFRLGQIDDPSTSRLEKLNRNLIEFKDAQ